MQIIKASNNQDWVTEQSLMPTVEIKANSILVRNIRNFKYRSAKDFDPNYYDKEFDLTKLSSVQLGIVPFSKFKHIVHVLTVFQFSDQSEIVFSIERRAKKNQPLSTWRSFFPYYGLIYIIGDRNDIIELREKHRTNEPVHLKKLNLNKEQRLALLLDFCTRTNQLSKHPEFFNGVTNSCSSNTIEHLNKIFPSKLSWFTKYLAPGYLHKKLSEKGYIAD